MLSQSPEGKATVNIPVGEFEAGFLPNICAVTGEPTSDRLRRRYSTTPPWALLGIFVGLIGILILALISQKTAKGLLPVSPAITARMRRRRLIGAGVSAASVGLCAVGIVVAVTVPNDPTAVNTSALIFLGGAIGLITGLLVLLAASTVVRVRHQVYDDTYGMRWLELRGVHPLFAHGLAIVAQQRQMGFMPNPAMLPPGWPLVAPQPEDPGPTQWDAAQPPGAG